MAWVNADGSDAVGEAYKGASITTAATTVVKSGAGKVAYLNILGGTLGAITVYDNTAASGTVLVPTFTPTGTACLILEVTFSVGLTIVTAAATVLQVSYS
jgi:hypothetical protein